jgi:hypothetical protein
VGAREADAVAVAVEDAVEDAVEVAVEDACVAMSTSDNKI